MEHFSRTDKIALITCLKKLNVSGAFLRDASLFQQGSRKGHLRAGHGFPSSTEGISDLHNVVLRRSPSHGDDTWAQIRCKRKMRTHISLC